MSMMANATTPQLMGKNPLAVRFTAALMRKAHSLWPIKTCAHLAAFAGVSPKAAEQWSAGTRTISVDALIELLRSEEGLHVLVALMDQARPKWWNALLRTGLFGSIQRRREADLRLMRAISDADAATPSQIPSALLFQDQEFYGAFLEGLAAAQSPGGQGGAVGPAKGSR